jgi:hypothetical protein
VNFQGFGVESETGSVDFPTQRRHYFRCRPFLDLPALFADQQ